MRAEATDSSPSPSGTLARSTCGLFALLVLASLPTPGEASGPTDPVRVFYPAGNCATGVIEIELWDRAARAWQPHPAHPRIMADTCQTEDAGDLLNEIRVRCIDPASPARASGWTTGVQVWEPAGAPGCAPPPVDPKPRINPRIRLDQPAAGTPVRSATATASLVGQVQLTHDLAVLVDRSLDPKTMKTMVTALDGLIARDADLLGPMRITWVSFAGDPASAGRGRVEVKAPSADRQRLRVQKVAGEHLQALARGHFRQAVEVRAIENLHAMPQMQQGLREMRADESGASQHQTRRHAMPFRGCVCPAEYRVSSR